MSLVQLTLRPPPHVDFVTGYPGIPPNGSDRPQAAVKGAIEVRVPAQGVKAQWVKVELRKVETLPGGGAANTFYDLIGPGSVTLWTSGGAEYEVLHGQDFPFSIRIPEAVPPSLQLEQRAGVHYELIATVCTKGKKGFFRKRKDAIASTTASVIIDKHDLHSTWPVYCQPEKRNVFEESGTKLTVERSQSCYGPGDRMSVTATVRTDSPYVIMLRGFEILLKETITFRGQMFVAGKKGEASTKANIISENRFQVNTPMQGGMQTTQDLFCMLSPSHTNTTLSAARHIDITYVLVVKALVGTGLPLVVELPVIVSNWQRAVSLEAMRRIGPTPGLSLISAPGSNGVNALTQQTVTRLDPVQNRSPRTSPSQQLNRPTTAENQGYGRQQNNSPFNTSTTSRADDPYGASLSARRPAHQLTPSQSSLQPSKSPDDFGNWKSTSRPVVGTGKRPPSAGAPQTQRFTITNALPLEIPEESQSQSSQHQRNGSASNKGPWLTATEEKQKLYEQAKARVEIVQSGGVQPSPSPGPPITQVSPSSTKAPSRTNAWPSAEEEKLKLFQSAQAAVARTQGQNAVPSAVDPTQASSGSKGPSAAAVMYSQAIAAVRNDTSKQTQSPPAPAKIQLPMATSSKPPKVPGYQTAEEEKAALRRYEDAKRAVDRVQGPGEYPSGTPGGSGPGLISYDSLYPAAPSGSTPPSIAPPPLNELPPPFDAGPPLTAPQQLSEKERLRRAYEAQDAAASLSRQTTATAPIPRQASPAVPPAPYDASPPPFSGGPAYSSATAEKELLRRRFEAQDAGMNRLPSPIAPQTPPRNGSVLANPTPARSGSLVSTASSLRSRPAPLPPIADGSGQRVLSAAEEKALLRARYEGQDSASSGEAPPPMYLNGYVSALGSASSSTGAPPSINSGLSYSSSALASPPPLMPRPPQEYIKETQEEDARVARMTMNGVMPRIAEDVSMSRKPSAVANPNNLPLLPPKHLGD